MNKETPHAYDAVETVLQQYGPMVYRLAFSHTGCRADADDVFQEVFLRYIRRLPDFESEEHAKAWFLRVTCNCLKNYWNAPFRKNTEELVDDIPCEDPEELGMQELMRQLPKDFRVILHLFYYEDMSTAQISRLTGRKESTVRVYLTRARRQLKEILEGGDNRVG